MYILPLEHPCRLPSSYPHMQMDAILPRLTDVIETLVVYANLSDMCTPWDNLTTLLASSFREKKKNGRRVCRRDVNIIVNIKWLLLTTCITQILLLRHILCCVKLLHKGGYIVKLSASPFSPLNVSFRMQHGLKLGQIHHKILIIGRAHGSFNW